MQSEETFDFADADASLTVPKQCSALRKNDNVMLRNRPCKIVEMSTSKPGKHGHAKIHLVGLDIFTRKKYEDLCPATHNMQIPIVDRKDYELMWIDDDQYCALFDSSDTYEKKDDLKLPDGEFGQQIRIVYDKDQQEEQRGILVTVVSAMGEEAIIGLKQKPKE